MRLIIKIGTSSLLTESGHINGVKLKQFADGIKMLHREGHSLALVTSGAVGAGMSVVHSSFSTVSQRQALAAIGQAALIESYRTALSPLSVAQILVTAQDFNRAPQEMHLRSTLTQLWEWRSIPLINENDVTTTGESCIGDNDTVAAKIAVLMEADQLVILSDVDGLYTANPKESHTAERIAQVTWVHPDDIHRYGSGTPGPLGSGGMATKLAAARITQEAGVEMLLMSSHEPNLWENLASQSYETGTRFLARKEAAHNA